MTMPWGTAGVLVAALLGLITGLAGRVLLARLRRGAVVRPGILEPLGAVLFAASALLAGDRPAVLVGCWLAWLTVVLSATDLAHHRLPHAITRPAMVVSLLLVTALSMGEPPALLRAALCGLTLWLIFRLVAQLPSAPLGGGDVALAPTLGLLLGVQSVEAVLLGVTLAFLLAGMVVTVLLVLRRVTRKDRIPFGPYLLAGAWLAGLLVSRVGASSIG